MNRPGNFRRYIFVGSKYSSRLSRMSRSSGISGHRFKISFASILEEAKDYIYAYRESDCGHRELPAFGLKVPAFE